MAATFRSCLDPNETTRTEDHQGDLRLVEEALRGRAQAVDRLIERLQCVPQILHQRNVRMGSPLSHDDLTDLTQETLAAVLRKLDSFAGRSTLETWVYSFCQHQIMNAIRSKRRRPQLAGEAVLDFPTEEARTPQRDALEFEHVYACLERIDQAQAAIIRLKHFSALTFEEIAARLLMSPNSVKTSYYRGLERLRGLLTPHLREGLA